MLEFVGSESTVTTGRLFIMTINVQFVADKAYNEHILWGDKEIWTHVGSSRELQYPAKVTKLKINTEWYLALVTNQTLGWNRWFSHLWYINIYLLPFNKSHAALGCVVSSSRLIKTFLNYNLLVIFLLTFQILDRSRNKTLLPFLFTTISYNVSFSTSSYKGKGGRKARRISQATFSHCLGGMDQWGKANNCEVFPPPPLSSVSVQEWHFFQEWHI